MTTTPTKRILVPSLTLALSACGGSVTPEDAQGRLPAPCQTLADGLWVCASRLESGAREPLLEALDAQKKAWLARAALGGEALITLERGCRDALDQVRGSTRELCAGIPWASATAAPTTVGPTSHAPEAGPSTEAR